MEVAVVNAYNLTPRELEAARIAAEGLSNRQVAEQMQISEGTVKQYLYHVYDKVGVWNRDQLRYKVESLK